MALFASAMLSMALAVHPPHQAAMALDAAAKSEALADSGHHAAGHAHSAHHGTTHGCPHQADPHPVDTRLEGHGHPGQGHTSHDDMRCPVCVQMAGSGALILVPVVADLAHTSTQAPLPAAGSDRATTPAWLHPPLRASPRLS